MDVCCSPLSLCRQTARMPAFRKPTLVTIALALASIGTKEKTGEGVASRVGPSSLFSLHLWLDQGALIVGLAIISCCHNLLIVAVTGFPTMCTSSNRSSGKPVLRNSSESTTTIKA